MYQLGYLCPNNAGILIVNIYVHYFADIFESNCVAYLSYLFGGCDVYILPMYRLFY